MSAALRVLSAWPYHATRTMRTGLTRYDVSTTLLDIVETIDHSSDYFANERDASCPFESLSFFNLFEGGPGLRRSRKERVSSLVKFFLLKLFRFYRGICCYSVICCWFFFNFRWGIIDRSSSKDFRETLIHDRWSLFLLVIRKNLLKIMGDISRRNLELLYPVKTILASTRNSIS